MLPHIVPAQLRNSIAQYLMRMRAGSRRTGAAETTLAAVPATALLLTHNATSIHLVICKQC